MSTSGKKAETIVLEAAGMRFTKRVFNGQRLLVVTQHDENDRPLVRAARDEAQAERWIDEAISLGDEVGFYGRAEPRA